LFWFLKKTRRRRPIWGALFLTAVAVAVARFGFQIFTQEAFFPPERSEG
jgi:hypothetical protein